MSTVLAGLTVIVARDDAPDDDISHAAQAAGALVVPLPLMTIVPAGADAIAAARSMLAEADVVVFTSRHAVDAVGRAPLRTNVVIAAVGEATARALREIGLHVDVIGNGGGAALAERLSHRVSRRRVVWPRGEGANDALASGLRAAGAAAVDAVDVYRSVPVDIAATVTAAFARRRPLALVMTSPKRVQALVEQVKIPGDIMVVAIGDTTAAACRAAGLRVASMPSSPAPDPVCAALAALHTAR